MVLPVEMWKTFAYLVANIELRIMMGCGKLLT